ncbi:MAG TPA: winged helix-turn-helix domain-containing protein, partial [Terriglobia bacterium]|nr:winged helix-turn-helix domain-containing protein [Terriglobia bacterium]
MVPQVCPRLVRFGVFEVDLGSGELFKNAQKVHIEEQPFQVLSILLEKPGQLVTRKELQQRLWPQDTFVDFEHSLNVDIQRL